VDETNSIHFYYCVRDVSILSTECIKDLDVMLDSKLHFHRHADDVYSQTLRMLALISHITHTFSSLENVIVLY
jgi:hypothetical protein